MTQNILKFGGGALLVVAVGLGALFAVDYIRYQKSPEYAAKKEAEQIKKEYREDPYGGETPEETLALFIDALKKGDTELAAKYFVLEKQEEWRADLSQIKEKGLLDEMVGDLSRLKKSKETIDESFFTATNEENIVSVLVNMRKHVNGKWKLADL